MAVMVAGFSMVLPMKATAATFQAIQLATGVYDASKAIPVASTLRSGAMVVARANPWGAALTVGLTLASIYVANSDKTTEFLLRAAGSPRGAPTGWTDNPADPANPNPPLQVAAATPYYTSCSGTAPWGGAGQQFISVSAAQQYCTTASGVLNTCGSTPLTWTTGLNQYATSGYTQVAKGTCNGNTPAGIYYYSSSPQYMCPAGYTLSGSICNLTSALSVAMPSDSGLPYVQPTADGTGWTTDPRRPDIRPAAVPATGPFTINGVDGSGNPVQLTLTPSTSGVQVDLLQQTIDSLNNSITQANHLTLNNQGQVTGISQDTKPGAITQYNTTNNSITNVSNTTGTVDLSGTNSRLDAIKAAEDADRADAAAKGAAAANQHLDPSINTLGGAGLPGRDSFTTAPTDPIGNAMPSNDGSCYTLSPTIKGVGTLTIDPCGVVNAVRPVLDWGLIFVGALGGLGVWFGRSEAED